VPVLVLVLGLAAGAAITALYRDVDASRNAQLEISGLRLDLASLQDGAFGADPRGGGSPARASKVIAISKARIRDHVRRLTEGGSAPGELNGLAPAIRRLYPLTDEIFAIGAGEGYGQSARTDALLRSLVTRRAAITRALDGASESYDDVASHSQTRATIGSAATLLLLLAAFLLFYLRSARARLSAEELAAENERLWLASHDDAITDALTGLRNRRALNQDFATLLTPSGDGPELVLAMLDLDGFKQYNDTFGHGAGDVLLARLGERLSSAMGSAATSYRMGGDEFCIVGRAGSVEGALLVDNAVEALSATGDGWSIGCSYGVVWIPSQAHDMLEALQVADQRMYANKASRASAGTQTTAALVQVLAEQGDGLDGHADAVAELSILLARELGLKSHDVQQIGLAAELHDIGKAAIPDAILNKPGALDDAEWEFIHRHTVIGERIILAAPALEQVAGIVRSSHERIDGKGYPDGLASDEIPIGSRIISVTDAFDAMVSERPYGSAVSDADAIAELERCNGTQFDADVVAAFLTVLAQRPVATA
jgi:diguanylate cyclase (GGDEF)-like protein